MLSGCGVIQGCAMREIPTVAASVCDAFSFIFLNLCAWEEPSGTGHYGAEVKSGFAGRSPDALYGRFETVYQWNYLNYTWVSPQHYALASSKGQYIPENNAFTGIKIYKDRIYLSVPRFRKGIPSTLNYIPQYSDVRHNLPLVPFPSWAANDESSCDNLQSVQSMEIDSKGIMWVIDGARINNFNRCPTKLLLLDLNRDGKLIHFHVFPNEIGLQDGGFLNDIVIDETDGTFAYITDNSAIDPGLIVYSKWKDRAWKLRDATMFSEPNAQTYIIDNMEMRLNGPIDGIALSPKPRTNKERTLFYCSLSGFKLHSIGTSILKNEQFVKSGNWRDSVKTVGSKVGQSDGLIMDNKGNLFYTLPVQYGVGKWNINTDFSTARIIDTNRREMIWPDTFAMDGKGFLYLNMNKVYKYIKPNTTVYLSNDIEFRVLKLYTGTRSYLYD